MATRYALRHRTTRMYLACRPDVQPATAYRESADVADAATWPTMTEAQLCAFDCFPEFEAAWDVVPVAVQVMSDFLHGQTASERAP